MKKLILLPLLFLGVVVKAQFNTASFKETITSVGVAPISETTPSSTFITYNIKGSAKKEKRDKTLDNEKDETRFPDIEESELGTEAENLSNESLLGKEFRYMKLDPITHENFATVEKQLVFMPLNRMRITSHYGDRYHPIDKQYKFHYGVDLRANDNNVYSVLDGIILDAGYTKASGNYIKVLHKGNFETIFLHLSGIFYKKDDIVKAGDIIASSGNTGRSTAPHLHFAVKENGKFIDPIDFLNDLISTNNAIADYEK